MIAFPTAYPDDLAPARLDPTQLADRPRWDARTLAAGPARGEPAYDAHVAASVGSSYDWSDELRFEAATGRLASFVLRMPEAGVLDPAVAESWLALPRTRGLPALEELGRDFHIAPVARRHVSGDLRHLMAANADLPAAGASSLRLAIHDGADLLFHDGRYCGWIAVEPVAHLAPGAPTAAEAPRLAGALSDYLALVVGPTIARMDDGDPEIRVALESLAARFAAIDAPAARLMQLRVADLLDGFYASA